MEYNDFKILVEGKDENNKYPVKAGNVNGFLELTGEIEKLRKDVEETPTPGEKLLKIFGKLMFNQLFNQEIKEFYDNCLTEARNKNRGLRIKLTINPAEVSALPWEFLYSPDANEFISNSDETPVVRCLPDGMVHSVPLETALPLKILVVLSEPLNLTEKGMNDLNLKEVRNGISSELKKLIDEGKVEIKFLEEATLETVRHNLEDGYHILHFFGHGGFEKYKLPILILEDDMGNVKEVSINEFEGSIKHAKNLKFVIFHSCETAKTSKDALFGAAQVISRHIPAVIGMQYTVTLVGANKFFEEFYHALANGNPVECAVSKGRQAVIEKYRTGRRDWGTPVLFMHSENGKIFDVKSKVAGKEKQKPERYNPINPSAMPDVSGYFVGKRDERLELLNLLKDTGKRIIIVHGLAGMGKTSLASKVVSENMDRFYAVFPFSIREYEGFEFLLRSINDFLAKNNDNSLQGIWNNPGIKVSDKIDCLIEALSGRDYLFIFDNFEDLLDENREIRGGEFKLLLDKIHKTKHKSKIIITTRFNFELSEGRYAGAMGSVLVDRFNEYGTIRFLNNLGLQDLDHETKKKIHERTGGHPFAIERFSGLAKKYSADSILKDDSLFRDDMEKKLTSKLYDAITQEEQDVLRRCSVFRGVFPLDAVKHFWGTLRTLNNLVDMHLIEHDERLDMYFIHRIIVDVAYNKFKTDKERKEAHKLAGEFYLNLNPIEAIDQFYLAEEFRKVIEVTEDIYQDLVTTGLWDEAIRKCEQGIEASRKISDRRYESISLGELGSMYMCRGDYENAENFFNKCLAIARQITNEKLIANSLHSLGICQAKKRNYEKAEELYIDSLKIARDINDEIGIAATLNQLGNIRLLNGKYEKAKEFYNESLEIKKHTGNKKGIATTIHQLGVIEHFQKNYEKAEKLYNESLEIAVQINAPELIAKILPQLSEIYKNRGDYKNAIKNLLIAENIFHKLNSPDTGGVLNNMMIIKEQLGEPEFNKYYNQAVKELQSG